MCKDDTAREYRCHPRHAHRIWRARRGRPGFNEDRRICPIKTSYKDPFGSALIRKTSNLDFAATAASYPRATPQLPAYRYPSRYRYRAPPSKPSRDFEQWQSRRGFMEVVSWTVEIPEYRSSSAAVIEQNAIREGERAISCHRRIQNGCNIRISLSSIYCVSLFNEF